VDVVLWLGERRLDLRLAAEGEVFRVTLDGTEHRAVRVGGATAAGAAELALEIDGRPHRALVVRTRERVLVGLAGRVYAFETGEAARRGHDGGVRSGTVTAPMPGKVVAVLVAVGDAVEPGQPLVVLEAMKMESTLVAEVGGRVTTVAATPGATVDGGALLVEIA
jgi:acetyl/propionyl-CoA carboxylase alpha subunit